MIKGRYLDNVLDKKQKIIYVIMFHLLQEVTLKNII